VNDLSTVLAVILILSWAITLATSIHMHVFQQRSMAKSIEDLKEENRHWIKQYSNLETKNNDLRKMLRDGGKIQAYLLDEYGIRVIAPDDYEHITRGRKE